MNPLSSLLVSGPMPVEEAVRVVCGAGSALTDVHGELTPRAILVGEDGVEVERPSGADRTRYGSYAAPERILGKPATPASDVYSLAVILYQALSGQLPFPGASPAEVMLNACSEAPRDLPPQVPHALEKIVMRGLSKAPGQRYESPAALRDALEAYQHRGAWAGRRVLAVDDEPPFRVLYQRMATRIGVEADVAATGREAIEAMKTCRYDVALLDLNLPRLNGWEVLDFLRGRGQARPQYLFIITGFVDQRVSDADRHLVTAVLYKPVAQDELQTLVTECLRGGSPDLASILKKTQYRASGA